MPKQRPPGKPLHEYPEIMTINEYAEYTRVGINQARDEAKLAGFPAFRKGMAIRVFRDHVPTWIESRIKVLGEEARKWGEKFPEPNFKRL